MREAARTQGTADGRVLGVMRSLLLALLTTSSLSCTGETEQTNYPLRTEEESVADYAKRAGIAEVQLDMVVATGVTIRGALIPPGRFQMGSPRGEESSHDAERPVHWVTISRPYYMGVTEVTVRQFRALMDKHPYYPGLLRSYEEIRNYPMTGILWQEAAEWCKLASQKTGRTVRLPTEAEWEYACRAGTTTAYNTGAKVRADQANCAELMPVACFPPNQWGLYDMHGNAPEWCSDWYRKGYGAGDVIDPVGPPTGEADLHVVRSGWGKFFGAESCRSGSRWARDDNDATGHWLPVGLRVVIEVDHRRRRMQRE